MSALTEALLEQLNELLCRANEMKSNCLWDHAKLLEDQARDVQKRLDEANAALNSKQLLKG